MKKLAEDPEIVTPEIVTVTPPPAPEKKNDNALLWVLVIALIGLVVLFYIKNRNDGTKE